MEELIIKQEQAKTSVWDKYVPIIQNGRNYEVYLTDGIDIPAAYNELCYVLNAAYDGDTVTLHINNGGGVSSSAFMIIAAIKNSKAYVKAKLSGMVASAATVIVMSCDEIEVAPYTQFMIHNYFHGAQGTGNQVKEYVNFTDSEFTAAVKEIYAGFITPEEMHQVSSQDKELWFGADETVKRWANKQLHDLGITPEEAVCKLA